MTYQCTSGAPPPADDNKDAPQPPVNQPPPVITMERDEGGPTPPAAVPHAGRDVHEVTAPCDRFKGKMLEITSIKDALRMKNNKIRVVAPYWKDGENFDDGAGSTHPATITTEDGSDAEMTIKLEVEEADGLAGTANLVGKLTDGTTIEWKGTFPVSVGEKTVTVKTDAKTTRLARHRGDIVWEADVPGCGKHVIGRTRVEIYRIAREAPHAFLFTGRPVEGMRFIYENMNVIGIDVAKGNATCDRTVTSRVTNYLHNGHGMTYDTNEGRSFFRTGAKKNRFLMTSYIAKAPGNIVNCYDQAVAVMVFAGFVGMDGTRRYVRPFGFIKTTDLVGGIQSNNPFFSDPKYDNAPVTNRLSKDRSAFGNHEFYIDKATDKVFDACAGPSLGAQDYDDYMEAVVDTAMVGYGVEDTAGGLAYWKGKWTITDDRNGPILFLR